MAFWVWVEFSVYGGQIKCRSRVLHTLIGRYALAEMEIINHGRFS
ncbi:DUF3265 domain-containing protein [Vibrio alginolyticus]|uniref:DUF3265 domain-containing protein n=1 Tax=Vibrio alginolyticus TaxID=663 RepID=A0A7Y4F113_VIBAL|nr:DUF3265 domain-containing protein [Vibrio alginolyticus]